MSDEYDVDAMAAEITRLQHAKDHLQDRLEGALLDWARGVEERNELNAEFKRLQGAHDDLARALFQIRGLTIRGKGDPSVARIAVDAVLHIAETPLVEVNADHP